MQTWDLPAAFASQTLTDILFTTYQSNPGEGEAFLAAATVSTIPEPSTFVLLGISGACFAGRSTGLLAGQRSTAAGASGMTPTTPLC